MEFTLENARMFSTQAFNRYIVELYEYLQVLENRLFSSGLHVLGHFPYRRAVAELSFRLLLEMS